VASDTGRAFVVIVRDVTERRAVERMKDEFVATVSHELRTPLTALRGHVELVLDGDGGPVTELQQCFLRVATQSADRLGALINDLLDVAKIEAGRVQLRKELVDLGAVLREVSSTFRIEATRHGLAFREDLAELPAVVGDRDRLIQVFGNLVSNAIKYTRAGESGRERAANVRRSRGPRHRRRHDSRGAAPALHEVLPKPGPDGPIPAAPASGW
jgi:signal transduction histidine kinase